MRLGDGDGHGSAHLQNISCRKGEHGRVLRRDKISREGNGKLGEDFKKKSAQDSKSASPTELVQFHLGCFRCNLCHVLLKERDGKRTLRMMTVQI